MGPAEFGRYSANALAEVLTAGDVASVVFFADHMDESEFQSNIAPLLKACQNNGVAAVVADHTRVAGRLGADGVQLPADRETLRQAIDKFTPRMMVGAANVRSRHTALDLGEFGPDFLMFGKPGGDIRPEPHPKNITLGEWWSSLVEIPCIVMGGTEISSAPNVARTGAEFVALRTAIFSAAQKETDAMSPAQQVCAVNQLLDDHAPRFEAPEDGS